MKNLQKLEKWRQMIAMDYPIFKVAAFFLLLASLSSADFTYVGSFDLSPPQPEACRFDVGLGRPVCFSPDRWVVSVYYADDGLVYYRDNGTAVMVYGLYSGRSIYIDGRLGYKEKAKTYAHEYCHAVQDYEGRAFDEKECDGWG